MLLPLTHVESSAPSKNKYCSVGSINKSSIILLGIVLTDSPMAKIKFPLAAVVGHGNSDGLRRRCAGRTQHDRREARLGAGRAAGVTDGPDGLPGAGARRDHDPHLK